MLAQLLDSLVAQESEDAVFEVLVVDNDPDRSAETVVARYRGAVSGGVQYLSQPKKNIALTRNLAVANARGRLLYFIDDDEVATPTWMQSLRQCMTRYEADAAFGLVTPRFHHDAPEWARSSFLFNRYCGETGTPTRRPRTSNCVVRAEVLAAIDGPFDERYGLTGGEDTYMFARLAAEGTRFVDCREAEVYEFQPPERTTWSWLRARAVRTGSLQSRREIDIAGGSRLVALRSLARGSTYAACCWAMTLTAVGRPEKRRNWLLRSYYGVGQIRGALGRVSNGY